MNKLDADISRSYINLMKSVIIQAIKDYQLRSYRNSVRNWVEDMSGSFDLCADSWGKTPEQLQELMLTKMDRMDKGERLTIKK